MSERPKFEKAETAEALATSIKSEAESFLQNPNTFQEEHRRSRTLDLDSQALSRFSALPTNKAQIRNVKMLVAQTDEETTLIKMEREGKVVKSFSDTTPRNTIVSINFNDKNRPHITFIYCLELKDGLAPRAYIIQKNAEVEDVNIEKPTSRASITFDLQIIRNLLRSLNQPQQLS